MKIYLIILFICLAVGLYFISYNSGSKPKNNPSSSPDSDPKPDPNTSLTCDKNQHVKNNICVCDDGFIKRGDTCEFCGINQHVENNMCVCDENLYKNDYDMCICNDGLIKDKQSKCTWKRIVTYKNLYEFKVSNGNIIAVTDDGVYIGNNQILKGNFLMNSIDVKDNYMILSDITGNIYESKNLKDFTSSTIKIEYDDYIFCRIVNGNPVCIINKPNNTLIYTRKDNKWVNTSSIQMTLSFLFCFKDNLQCMIDNKNYLYISNDYTNWKKINLPTPLYDDQFLNTLQIIGDTIYICCYDYIYSTNYKNIKWEQQIKRYNLPWLGVVQNPNNDNIFIIYTADNLYLTKDGGKTFDYLLVSGQSAGDKNINLVNQTVCVTSNQIYFQLQNEIYTKTYD
jgi:hypothetical protein